MQELRQVACEVVLRELLGWLAAVGEVGLSFCDRIPFGISAKQRVKIPGDPSAAFAGSCEPTGPRSRHCDSDFQGQAEYSASTEYNKKYL